MRNLIPTLCLLLPLIACGKSDGGLARAQKVSFPCSKYSTNSKHFYGVGIGTSLDQAKARDEALLDAQTKLAMTMQVTIQGLLESYDKEYGTSKGREFSERSEGMKRSLLNQSLEMAKIQCDEGLYGKNKESGQQQYNWYIAVGIDSDAASENTFKAIDKDEKLKLDYDYSKFRDKLQQELEMHRAQ